MELALYGVMLHGVQLSGDGTEDIWCHCVTTELSVTDAHATDEPATRRPLIAISEGR